jgi:hypothetical protein
MPTRAWSAPACGTSSTKRATSPRPPASYHVHPQTDLGELHIRGYGTGHGRRVNGSAFGLGTPDWRLWSNHRKKL